MKTHHLHAELRLERPVEGVFPFFSDPRNLETITPPWLRFRILRATTPAITAGTEIEYRLRLRGIPLRWRSRIAVWEPPLRFVDEQVQGPYRLWRHLHSFEPDGEATIARDWVEYAAPGGPIVQRVVVAPDLERIFAYRARALSAILGTAGLVLSPSKSHDQCWDGGTDTLCELRPGGDDQGQVPVAHGQDAKQNAKTLLVALARIAALALCSKEFVDSDDGSPGRPLRR
jgi:ligand-binding SRPBCC domain-containing protein